MSGRKKKNQTISKNKIRLIRSLRHQKYREQYKLFIAEGEKTVMEMLSGSPDPELEIKPVAVCGLSRWIAENSKGIQQKTHIFTVEPDQMKWMSALTSHSPVLGVFSLPRYHTAEAEILNRLSLYLEDIRDPGNLGTIIRIADWFGIRNVFCSPNSVDHLNPKVVQATMGSLMRVKVRYTDPRKFLGKYHQVRNFPVYAATLEGENIFRSGLRNYGLIVFGNESRGISEGTLEFINHKLSISCSQQAPSHPDSLNIAVSAGIVCSEFARRSYSK